MFKGQGLLQITGHSKYSGVMPPYYMNFKGNFKLIDTSVVDNETWHTVQVIPKVGIWLKTQPRDLWHEHKTANDYRVVYTFDINEKLYTLLILSWSEQ